MAALNALIAQGGTGVASPIDRYMQTRQMMNQERRNALSESQVKQGMQHAEQTQASAQQEQQLKMIAPVIRQIQALPVEQREGAYQAAKPTFQSFGITEDKIPPNYDENMATSVVTHVYGRDKGSQINALVGGQVVGASVNEMGQIVDTVTRRVIPGATKAPTKQITGTPEQMGLESKGKRDKLKVDAAGRAESLYAVSGAVNSIIDTIENTPHYVGGAAGTFVDTINSMGNQFQQITGSQDVLMPDGKFNPEKMGNLSKENISFVRKAAIERGRTESAVLELAFVHAKLLNNSGKISDRDIQAARDIIEGGADRAIQVEKLNDLVRRSHSNYQAARKSWAGQPEEGYWKDITMDELMPTRGGGATGGGASAKAKSAVDSMLQGGF